MQEEGYVSTGDQQLHYLKYGSGPQLLLAFHGYGDDARSFRVIVPFLEHQYTLISINLPFHGGSAWPDNMPLGKDALCKLVAGLLQLTGREKLSLIGYSIGGRVCLCIIELLPDCIEGVVLIAPDGLERNYIYYFSTRTIAGRFLFRNFLFGSKTSGRIVYLLRACRLLDASRYKFVMRYLGPEDQRQLLLRVWLAMRLLLPGRSVVRAQIRRCRIPVSIFMGRYDRVIPLRLAWRFRKDMPSHVQVHVLEKGHVMFDTASVQKMAECLL